MTLDEAINFFGNRYRMCKALDISYSACVNWKRKNKVPLLQQYRIEVMSKGALKVDDEVVTKHDKKIND